MRRWGVVLAIGLAIITFSIDMNIVALALPVMGKAFGQADEAMSAVILSFAVPSVVLMLPMGLVVTRWQPLTTFLLGIAGFGAASVLCALAPSFEWLLVGRGLQGVAGALLGTQGVALVGAAVRPDERGRAMGIIGSMGPLGAIMGPGIGGFLLSLWGWTSIFLINVPIVVVAMVVAVWSFPSVNFGLTRRSGGGLGSMGYLLRHPRFMGSMGILLTFAATSGVLSYFMPFTLQDVQRLDLATAGATMLVPPLAMAIMGPLGGYLMDRFGVQRLLPAGWVVALVGWLTLLMAIATPTSIVNLDWRLFLIGVGNGMAYGPLLAFMMSVGPRETMGAASALSGITRQLGFIVGPILVSALWSMQGSAVSADQKATSSVWLVVGLTVVGLVGAVLSVRGWSQSEVVETKKGLEEVVVDVG